MANIVLPYRWREAPEYPVEIDWSNPLASGLVAATPLGTPASGNWYDPILLERAVATATNLPSPVIREIGRAADFVSLSSQGLKFVKAPITALPLTMSAQFFYSGSGTARTVMSYGRNSSGSGRFQLYEATTPDVRAFAANAAGTSAEASVGSLTASKWYQLAAVFKSTTSRTAFANGRSGSENTTSIAFDWTPEAISYGARYNAGWGLYANGAIQIPKVWNRELSQEELLADYENPWQVFKPLHRRLWILGSVSGGTTTIDCTVGNAVAAGVGFTPQSSLPTSVGNAVAAGVSTIFADTLQTVIGNAVAAGTSFLPQESLPTTLGNAVAAGTTADITLDSGITITCTVGNAVADGVATTFAVSLATSVGDAAAAGVTATFEVSIPASIGNAVADGVQAAIELSTIIGTAIGDAVAAGVTATITLQAGTIARPSSDVAVNCWLPSVGSDLYAMLDETTADDADYIYANSACACTVGLSSVADPGTSSGQVLSYRAWSPSGNGLVVRLKEGTTTIATWTHATLPLTVTQYDRSLSAAECDAITNYSNLRIEFEST